MTPYPLSWPDNIPRWKGARQPGAFKTTLAGAMNNVRDSLRKFGNDSGKPIKDADVVISSNVTLGRNNPEDPGVSIWFIWDGLSVCIPVDRYSKVEANLQAIFHVIEARRTELRHGTLALVRASFTGFAALPAPASKRPWRDVLGFGALDPATADEIADAYRKLSRERHPDRPGGSHDLMAELNAARAEALKEITS